MTINITGRHLDLTPAIRNHAEKKIAKLGRLVEDLDLHVTLGVVNHQQSCTIVARGRGGTYTGEVTDDDLFAAINEAVDVLARQLRKSKTSRLADRRGGAESIRHLGEEAGEA